MLLLVLVAALAPLLAPQSPIAQDLAQRLQPPSAAHWLGTDELGRDIYSRIVWGSRITLTIVALVVVIVGPVGLLVGTVAGYAGGWLDTVLMRVTDVFLAFPRLILALAFVAALGPGHRERDHRHRDHRLAALRPARPGRDADRPPAATSSPPPGCRAPRRCASSCATSPRCAPRRWSSASRSTWPASSSPPPAWASSASAPSRPPPEWGAMISTGRQYVLDYWWVATMPGLAIVIVSLGFNLLGDGLRDVLDPKQR